jgi:hypothetical protein
MVGSDSVSRHIIQECKRYMSWFYVDKVVCHVWFPKVVKF